MRPRLSFVASAAAIACLASACSAARGLPSAAIPASKLGLMPLPLTSFDSEAAPLRLDQDESGVSDNAKAAADSTDRTDSAASLEAAGRITGYSLSFGDYSLFGKPGKLVYVSSGVELYRDAASASTGIARQLGDVVTDDPSNGVDVVTSSRFDVPGIGDRAVGMRVKLKLGSATLWLTGVVVRRGELTESVELLRTDARPADAPARALARALAARVEGVLAGRVTTPPAKLPAATSKRTVKPTVEIAMAALTSADLNGAGVTRQEYVADSDALAAYQREFDGVKYGSSRLANAESDVSLLGSASEVAVYVDAVRSVLDPKSGSFKKFLEDEFAKGAGFKLTFSVVRRATLTLSGGKAYEMILRLNTPFGGFDVALVFIGSGRFVGALDMTTSPGAMLAPGDVVRLAGVFATRMQAAAKQLKLTA
jgi:hypothetical protein